MPSVVCRLVPVALLVVASACHDDASVDAGPDASVVPRDLGPDARLDLGFDACSPWECFGHEEECVDGSVYQAVFGEIPCAYWHGTCFIGGPALRCDRGCRSDGVTMAYDETDPRVLCEEHRPRAAGEPCAPDGTCGIPVRVYVDGGVGYRRTACAADAGTCVDVPPPSPPGFDAPCAVASLPAATEGVVVDPSCSAGLCGFSTCATCTMACVENWDCPDGSRCIETFDRSADAGADTRTRVCSNGCVTYDFTRDR